MLRTIGLGLGGSPGRRSDGAVRILNAKAIAASGNDGSRTRHRGRGADYGDGTCNADKRCDVHEDCSCASDVTTSGHSRNSGGASASASDGGRARAARVGLE